MDNIGFRILPAVRKVPDELLVRYREFVTPHLSDNMNRLNAVSGDIRPMHRSGRVAGSAFTVKTRPGDNLLVHKAIDTAGPGDIIIIDAGGDITNAIMGEIMATLAKTRGIEGFVVDGAIRDAEAIHEMNYPIYARGITHRGPYKDGPGEINVPVQIGGMIIEPGDLIVGDMDGLVAVRPEHAEALVAKVEATIALEAEQMAAIAAGTLDRSWVDKLLRSKGCAGV